MPLLIERSPEDIDGGDICPICNRSKKLHTIVEIQICSKKLKDFQKSGK
ncbi:MAG: hypothetical protein OEL56_03225 [Nitrosopumilus sp.]|nr:hypothetical protein [Nitrosopumilus sp.]MDH3489438.1 hypothetical protein [Nitrosopumilus sp.]MDH3516433.1 hypothetical protein [Nitrosopumilus sp.]MDH3565371.1 hypothetical protein [Nitrosopumilus sp.]MDH5416915.1 hypothetical protein [Nitrosopumilus sp.]